MKQAYRPDDPWTPREIIVAALTIIGMAFAILVFLAALLVLLMAGL